MFYLGTDQHSKQLTISLRNEGGKAVVRRQVSTEPERVREFLHQLENQCFEAGGYVAVVEVCGFNDWLLKLLPEYGCKEVVLVQPEERDRRKTDRRDAHRLSELLWINRERLLAGEHVKGLRRVYIPSADEQHDRQLTQLRKRLGASRTRLINRVKHALVKHNLQHGCPTKGIRTQAARAWLEKLALPAIDRLEVDQALAQWDLIDEQIAADDEQIAQRAESNANARLIATLRDEARLRGARLGGEHWSDLAFPAAAEPGQLLGSDSELPQLGRDHSAAGLDHQAGEQDGAFPALSTLATRAAPRRLDARVVQADQASPGLEDRARGSGAASGDDHLADALAAAALRDRRPWAQPFCGGEQE